MRHLILTTLVLYTSLSSLAIASDIEKAACAPSIEKSIKMLEGDLLQKIESLKHCPTDDEDISKLVTSEYQQFYGKQKIVTKSVKGFNLKGPEGEVNLAIEMLGSKPPKTWKAAATGCETVQCAFGKLLNSKTAAMQIFNFKAKSGYFLSLDQTINQGLRDQAWSAKTVQELDAAVTKFPSELKNLNLKKIQLVADGLRMNGDSENVAAFADNRPELIFYDAGTNGGPVRPNSYESTSWPQEVLTHETCHHHDFKGINTGGNLTSEQKNSTYKKLSGWKEVTNANGSVSWVHNPKAEFVSWYAESSPAEDYAETCMNYILHPETLEKKAPLKYAYMKSTLFHGKEFKDKPWTKSKINEWPKLKEQLADESFCSQGIATCLPNLKYESTQFCVHSTSSNNSYSVSCGSAQSQIQNNPCVMKMKQDRITEMLKTLEGENDFCQLGGPGAVNQQLNKVCANSANEFAKTLESLAKIDMAPAVSACESENDYSKACVISKSFANLNVKEEYKKIVNDFISNKVPDRMNAVANQLEKKSDNIWLKSCLNSIGKITEYNVKSSTGAESTIYDYQSNDSKVSSAYLGKYIYDGYDQKDANSACAANIVESLKNEGIKVPESGSPVNIMKKIFKEEIQSLETEVFGKIADSTKKCLILKSCKEKAIYNLLKDWESKSPVQRAGFATEEYAKELQKKWSSY